MRRSASARDAVLFMIFFDLFFAFAECVGDVMRVRERLIDCKLFYTKERR
jgi:hypothetical protein